MFSSMKQMLKKGNRTATKGTTKIAVPRVHTLQFLEAEFGRNPFESAPLQGTGDGTAFDLVSGDSCSLELPSNWSRLQVPLSHL